LDFLVEQTFDKEEVLGARLMGGGFGGCTINIVKTEKVTDFIQQMIVSYQHHFNRKLVCHVVKITEGVEKLN
jgi:galactokinase